jgi:lactose/L-arabinose transport system permease protein
VYSLILSFQQRNGFGPVRFIGLHNYAQLMSDDTFWHSIVNTFEIWAGNVVLVVVIAFLMALLLNSKNLRFGKIFTGIFYVPQAVAIVALSLSFGFILDKDFGVVNALLRPLGFPRVPWLLDPTWAKTSLIAVLVWRVAPWHMMVLFAGLKSIEEAIYEAARIDGASSTRIVVNILIPILRPIFFYCFLMATIFSFQLFAEPYVITGGGPGDATTTLALYMYKTGFQSLQLGYASAVSFVLLVALSIVSTVQLGLFRKELS